MLEFTSAVVLACVFTAACWMCCFHFHDEFIAAVCTFPAGSHLPMFVIMSPRWRLNLC